MKRIIVTITLVAAAGWILAIPAAAQGRSQSHPGGGSAAAGSMGASGTHGNSATAGGSHGSSNPMASTDPGSVLEHNSHLATKLETLTGTTNLTDLEKDASAFKNFMTNKTAVGATSTCTNTTKMSLGKAIQTLDPQADSKSESKKATNQANQDVKDSSGS